MARPSNEFMITLTGGTVPKLSVGARTLVVGDSIIQFEGQASAGAALITNDADSELHWALFRCGPTGHPVKSQIWADANNTSAEVPDRVTTYGDTTRVATGDILYSGGNQGYAGDTATGVAKRIVAGRNIIPDLVIYAAGTNVGTTDSPVSVVTGKIEEYAAGVKAGIIARRMIVLTVRPREVAVSPTGLQISPASMQRIIQINTWIKANASRLGYTVADNFDDLRDPAYGIADSLYGTVFADNSRDGVHLAPRGAYKSSRSLYNAISSLVTSGSWFDVSPLNSNLLGTSNFPGVGGTANNGASGVLPTGCFLSNVSGAGQPVTCVTSVEANPYNGGQSIVMNFTSTGAGAALVNNVFNLSFTNPAAPAAGQYVQAYFLIEVGASTAATLCPGFQATLGQGSTITSRGFGQVVNLTTYNNNPPQPFPDEALGTGWIVTEPFAISTQTTLNPRLNMAFRADIAGSKRIKCHGVILRTVSSPVTEFPWTPV